MSEPTHIAYVGDMHGNAKVVCQLIDEIAEIRDEMELENLVILQLGDFGYWEHIAGGDDYLDVVSEKATEKEIIFYWIDGNHENHVLLRRRYSNYGDFWPIRQNLVYIRRGSVWKWGGKNFLAMGGAYSIDRGGRVPGWSYWDEEEIQPYELTQAISNVDALMDGNEKIDIMVAHDVPASWPVQVYTTHFSMIERCLYNRQSLQALYDFAVPSEYWHGHYHAAYSAFDDNGCRFTGLAHDGFRLEHNVNYAIRSLSE